MLQKNLPELRKKKGLSQEGFAEIFHVTRQSVQKWESGETQPTIDRLLEIADYFHVSVDALLGRQKNDVETMRTSDLPVPNYDTLDTWDDYASQLLIEEQQCADEGRDTSVIKELVAVVSQLPRNAYKAELADTIYRMTLSLPQIPDYPFVEPSSYDAIDALCEHSAGVMRFDETAIRNKIAGAITGRVCGCLLGKPIEEMKLRELIPFLRDIGNYPLSRYVLSSDLTEKICAKYTYPLRDCLDVCADRIDAAPSDDDLNYMVLASEILLRYGREFKSSQIAREWLTRQSKFSYCTAERVAYRNFINGYPPPSSAEYKNPYREWIGAQIRADFYGYINPGNPRAAAEMAWRDASVSHIKNGIYGAMFVAAMIAAAAVISSPEKIVECGLGEIPATSRLHQAIRRIVSLYCSGKSRSECFLDIHSRYNDERHHDWCHVIPNAEIVVASLLYGKKDYASSVCLAVEAGFDTDCNGATVGSIVGMIGGLSRLPSAFVEPIHGGMYTSVFGTPYITTEELTDRAMSFLLTPSPI